MSVVYEIPEIRSEDIESPVQVWRDEETGHFFIRGINEGGFSCIDINIRDLAEWLGANADDVISALAAGEYPCRYVARI